MSLEISGLVEKISQGLTKKEWNTEQFGTEKITMTMQHNALLMHGGIELGFSETVGNRGYGENGKIEVIYLVAKACITSIV